jgi:hypothetical protein
MIRTKSSSIGAAVFLMTLAVPVTPATAQQAPFPEFDVKKACASNPQRQACRAMENEARNEAASLWSQQGAARKGSCLAVATSVPNVTGGSYIALLGCLRKA